MNPELGDANRLVEENLALVGYSVNEVLARVPAYVSRSDLTSAGSLALVRASRSFDPTKGVPFARYASMRIRGALIDELRSMDWVPRGARQRARQVQDVTEQLAARLERAPSKAEIAATMGLSVAEVDAAAADNDARVLSLEAFDGVIADVVVDAGVGPLDAVLSSERHTYLRAGVECLPAKLRYVIEQLFLHDRPVVELAEELGVTRSRVSQLRSEALSLLKDGLEANLERDAVPVVDPDEGVAERRRQAYFAAIAATTAATTATAATARDALHAHHPRARSVAGGRAS